MNSRNLRARAGSALLLALSLGGGLFSTASIQAQPAPWPAKPVHVINGFPPGSAPDTVMRMIAERIGPAIGQTVLVENRVGAAGTIAATAVSQAAPDGYTVLLGFAANITVAPHLLASARYNPTTDFAPIGLIQRSPYFIAVRGDLPMRTFQDLVAEAKARPGALNYASIGVGSQHHLTWEVLSSRLGINVVHVPLSGTVQAIAETIGGRTEVIIDAAGTAFAAQAKAGKLRLLAMTGSKPLAIFPEVPALADLGLPGFESLAWWGMLAPPGTPAAIVTRLNAELNRAIATPEVAERLRQEGAIMGDTMGTTPADLGRWIATEYERWGRVIRDAGIKVQ
jgi:tripartite-type tricarboxylate transporter receptor subunit TctC